MYNHVPWVEMGPRSSWIFTYCYDTLYIFKRHQGCGYKHRVLIETRRPNFRNYLNDAVMR